MANYSRWDAVRKQRHGRTGEERAAIEQGVALGELIYELRTSAGLSQRELAERMGTTQSVISRHEEGDGGRPRLDTSPATRHLARVATALDRHLVVSFPELAAPEHRRRDARITRVASGRSETFLPATDRSCLQRAWNSRHQPDTADNTR